MMTRLTESQRTYLNAQPVPAGHFNKIRLALRLVDSNQSQLAERLGIANQQLSRYVGGGDLRLSTAWRIAAQFGLTVCDLWPLPPGRDKAATATTPASRTRRAKKARPAKSPKAVAA